MERIYTKRWKQYLNEIKFSIKPDSAKQHIGNVWITDDNYSTTYVWEAWLNHDQDMQRNYRVDIDSIDPNTRLVKFNWEGSMNGSGKITISQNDWNKILSNYDSNIPGELIMLEHESNEPYKLYLKFKKSI